MKHVLVYGPPACGKTRNAAALAKAFGCPHIVDGAHPHEIEALASKATVSTLFLALEGLAQGHQIEALAVEAHAFHDAMRKAGLQA